MAKHANKFKPEVGTFYPKGNDICAYCLPAFPESLIPAFKLEDRLQDQVKRFDQIESRLHRLEQKNDISPPKGGRGKGKKDQFSPDP